MNGFRLIADLVIEHYEAAQAARASSAQDLETTVDISRSLNAPIDPHEASVRAIGAVLKVLGGYGYQAAVQANVEARRGIFAASWLSRIWEAA